MLGSWLTGSCMPLPGLWRFHPRPRRHHRQVRQRISPSLSRARDVPGRTHESAPNVDTCRFDCQFLMGLFAYMYHSTFIKVRKPRGSVTPMHRADPRRLPSTGLRALDLRHRRPRWRPGPRFCQPSCSCRWTNSARWCSTCWITCGPPRALPAERLRPFFWSFVIRICRTAQRAGQLRSITVAGGCCTLRLRTCAAAA